MKKKLIAAILSVAMVASMVPATAFAAQSGAPAKAVTQADQTTIDQAIAAIKDAAGDPQTAGDTQVSYTPAYKAKLDKAGASYNGLDAAGKAAVGDQLAARLEAAQTLYKVYTDAITEVDNAFAAVKTIKADDQASDTTVYGKAYKLFSDKKVDAVDAKAVTGGGVAGATISAKELTNTELVAALSTETAAKKAAADKAYTVVQQIKNTKTPINKSNYEDQTLKSKISAVKTDYNNLTDEAQAMVGNYGAIVAMENNIAIYNKAVKDMTELNTDAYKAAIDGTIGGSDVTIGTATTDTAAVKAAFNNLKKDVQDAVTAKNPQINAANIAKAEENIKTYNEKLTDEDQANLVIEKIRALKAPASIGLSDKAAIEDARASYNALSAVAVKIVKNETGYLNKYKQDYEAVLKAAEAAYNKQIQAETDTVRVDKMTAMTAALPEPNSVTTANEAAVLAAKAYFENDAAAVTIKADGTVTGNPSAWQKLYAMGEDKAIALDTATASYKKLVACIQVLQSKTDAETTAASKFVTDYLNKLSDYTGDGSYIGTNATRLANAQTNLANAKTEYAKLDARVQTLVQKDAAYGNIAKTEKEIEKAQESISEAAQIENVNTLIKAVKDAGLTSAADLTKDNLSKYEAKITAATTAYNQLSQAAQAKVTDGTYLDAVAAKMKQIKDEASISSIEAAIEKVTIVKTDGTETEATLLAAQTQIKAAAALFNDLSLEVQEEIANAGRLAKAEKALADAATKLANTEFAKIGNVTAGITDSQVTMFNDVVRILTEFGLEGTVITATNPTFAQVEKAVTDKEAAATATVKTAIAALPTTVTKDYVNIVYNVEKQYNALSDTLKKQITASELAKLKDAVKQADALSLTKATIVVEDQTYTGSEIKPEITVKDANGIVIDPSQYDVIYKDNTEIGTATVTIHALDSGKYEGQKTAEFQIKKEAGASLEKAIVTGVADKVYNGKTQSQKVTVKLDGKTLEEGKDYILKYGSNKNIGTAKFRVAPAEGSDYTESYFTTFKINPAKAAINSLQVGKAKLRVNIKAQTGGVKYQIHYKKTSDSKYKTLNTSLTSKTLSGIKAKTKYTVKVRAYKSVNGKVYYGSFSSLKKATTK